MWNRGSHVNYQAYLEESLTRLRTIMDDSGSRPILFVGSGMSRRYLNAPDWLGLLKMLVDQNPNKKFPIGYYTQTNEDLPAVASALVDEYKDYAWEEHEQGIFPKHLYDYPYSKSIFLKFQVAKIFDEFMRTFNLGNNVDSRELELLGNLQPHAIVTTNYDCMLETIFPKHSVIIGQQVIKTKDATNIGQLLKIHGCMTRPEEIVISSEDYKMFHDKQKYLTAKLLTYFMEHPIILLGYSVSDSNIKGILADIAEMVCSDPDEIVSNIWFVDWRKDVIESDFRPPADKNIELGNGKTIRVNYLLVNSYEKLFESLYQDSATSVDVLRDLQGKIYNIVKSRSISELEVDLVAIKNISDEKTLASMIGFKSGGTNATGESQSVTLLGVGTISEPEQIKARYPFRLSDVAQRLGFNAWNYANQLIDKIAKETGVNIKESSNRYHIDVGVMPSQPQHRYSIEAVELLHQVQEIDDYYVYNELEEKVNPKNLLTNLI
jgi:hypothetical protein